MKSVYGLQDPNEIDNKEIKKVAEKYNIGLNDLYELDQSYIEFVMSKGDKAANEDDKRYRTQPLQVMYYKNNSELSSYHVNCLASGFPKLNWNQNENFEVFPPNTQAPLNQSFPLNELMAYFKPVNPESSLHIDDYDYVIVVFWNKFMSKQSKHLIKVVKENKKLIENENTRVIYVNNDNLFSKYINDTN